MFLCNYATPLQEKKFINFLTKKHIKNASSFSPSTYKWKAKKFSRFASQNTKKKTQKKLWITKHFLLDKRHDDDFMNKLCAFLHHICLQTTHFLAHKKSSIIITIIIKNELEKKKISLVYNQHKILMSNFLVLNKFPESI